jgi:hypothetical protein
MEDIKENRILLTEATFTNLCKMGFIKYQGSLGKSEMHFTRLDIIELVNGGIVTKDFTEDVFKIGLQDIGLELIKEIIKRSPIYSELSNSIK